MDYINEVTIAAFEDEMEKIGGIGDYLIKGIRGWQSAFRGAAKAAKHPGVLRKGAPTYKSWGDHGRSIKRLYQRGAKDGGWTGGVSKVLKSPYGAMGATAGLGAAAVGGVASAMPRFGKSQQSRGY